MHAVMVYVYTTKLDLLASGMRELIFWEYRCQALVQML